MSNSNMNSISKFANKAIPLGHEMTCIVKQMNHKLYNVDVPALTIKMQYGTFVEDNEQHNVYIEAMEDEFYVYFSKSNKKMYLLECVVSDIGNIQVRGGSLAAFID